MQDGPTRRWQALGALSAVMLTISLDVTVLTTALPTLALDLHADTSALQWFSTVYTLVLASFMLPAGALGDRYGRRRLLVVAMLVFAAASLMCAFAQNSGELIAARALLGLGAAVMMPLSISILPVLFPNPAERLRAMTIWGTANALGMPLGPLLGGWLLRNYWWGSVFLINVPVVLLAAVAVARLVPESRNQERTGIDWPGAILSGAGMLGITYGFIHAGQQGWDNRAAWLAIAAGIVLLALFLAWLRRSRHPLIDMSLFADGAFRWGTVYSLLIMFALFGLLFTVPQYFQAVLGTDAVGSGLRLLPMIGGLTVGAKLGETLATKAGVRKVLALGFGLFAVGMGFGAFTTITTGYGVTAAWLVVVGLGAGFTMPIAMSLALNAFTAERSGSASALLNAFRQAGGTIGTAILGTILATRYHSGLGSFDHAPISSGVNAGVAAAHQLGNQELLTRVQTAFLSGMSSMFWVGAAICAATVVLVWFTCREPAQAQTPNESPEVTIEQGAQ